MMMVNAPHTSRTLPKFQVSSQDYQGYRNRYVTINCGDKSIIRFSKEVDSII